MDLAPLKFINSRVIYMNLKTFTLCKKVNVWTLKGMNARFQFDHYGCKNACASCRNFFRRSVMTQHFLQFKCKERFERLPMRRTVL
jgi:hypothetical protein